MDRLTKKSYAETLHEIIDDRGAKVCEVNSHEYASLIAAAPQLKQACERALKHVNHAYKAFPTNELKDLQWELTEALEKANDY